MKHAIVGAGGVGGLLGASLRHAGDDVTMVVRKGTRAKYPQTLHVDSTFATFDENVEWTERVPEADVLWLAVKALQLEDAVALIEQGAKPNAIVPLLNGLDHIALLRSKFGENVVIPATIAIETERTAPGQIVHRSPFAKLNVSSRGQTLMGRTLEQLHQIGFTGEFIDNEATLMWGKLVFLGPLALSTTAANKAIGELVSNPETWTDLQTCVREACAVGTAEGAKLNVDVVIKAILTLPAPMKSSMQKDVEQGRAPEVDAIGGGIVRAAKRHNIRVPVTERLIAAVAQRAGIPVPSAEGLTSQGRRRKQSH
jgi:2-dehydropantoate 2-reductase